MLFGWKPTRKKRFECSDIVPRAPERDVAVGAYQVLCALTPCKSGEHVTGMVNEYGRRWVHREVSNDQQCTKSARELTELRRIPLKFIATKQERQVRADNGTLQRHRSIVDRKVEKRKSVAGARASVQTGLGFFRNRTSAISDREL